MSETIQQDPRDPRTITIDNIFPDICTSACLTFLHAREPLQRLRDNRNVLSQEDQWYIGKVIGYLLPPYLGLVFINHREEMLPDLRLPKDIEWAVVVHYQFLRLPDMPSSIRRLQYLIGVLVRAIHIPQTVSALEIDEMLEFLIQFREYLHKLHQRLIHGQRELHFRREEAEK